jgi:hypothetical protein
MPFRLGGHYDILEIAAVSLTDLSAQRHGMGIYGIYFPVIARIREYFGDAIVILIVSIKGQLIPDPKSYQQGRGHAYRETGDIYEGLRFVFSQVA